MRQRKWTLRRCHPMMVSDKERLRPRPVGPGPTMAQRRTIAVPIGIKPASSCVCVCVGMVWVMAIGNPTLQTSGVKRVKCHDSLLLGIVFAIRDSGQYRGATRNRQTRRGQLRVSRR
jgi:hypothetical protein